MAILLGNPVDKQHPLNRGRVSWWHTLPSGVRGYEFRDLCGKSHGTLTNGPTWGSAKGQPGGWGSLNFTAASSQYVNGSGLSIASTPFTVAVSFLYAGNTGTFFGAGSAGGTRNAMYLQLLNSYQLSFGMYGDDHTFSFPGDDFVSGQWYRVVFTMDASFNERVYRNGKACPDNPIVAGGFFVGDSNWSIGRRIDSTPTYYDGYLDNVTAAGRDWSVSEAMLDYDLSLQGYPGLLNRVEKAITPFAYSAAAPPVTDQSATILPVAVPHHRVGPMVLRKGWTGPQQNWPLNLAPTVTYEYGTRVNIPHDRVGPMPLRKQWRGPKPGYNFDPSPQTGNRIRRVICSSA
jgi:hypothetical protein